MQVQIIDTLVAQIALTSLHRVVLPTLDVIYQYLERWDSFQKAFKKGDAAQTVQRSNPLEKKAAEFFRNIDRVVRNLAQEDGEEICNPPEGTAPRDTAKLRRISFRERLNNILADTEHQRVSIDLLIADVVREAEILSQIKQESIIKTDDGVEAVSGSQREADFGEQPPVDPPKAVKAEIEYLPSKEEVIAPLIRLPVFFLRNLIMECLLNAQKSFTSQRRRRIKVTIYYSNPVLWLSVMDSGSGMLNKDGFLYYRQPFATGSATHEIGNDGLGLYICARTAEITGTEFYVLSPMAEECSTAAFIGVYAPQ